MTKDALNLLKVGPQSAGSMPGPICHNQRLSTWCNGYDLGLAT